MCWQACVFARKDAALIGYIAFEQIGVLWLKCVDGEIHRRLGSGSAPFGGGCPAAAAWGTICIGFACHII